MDIGQKLASVLQAASLANIVPHKAFTPTLDDAAVSRSEDSVYRSLLRQGAVLKKTASREATGTLGLGSHKPVHARAADA